MNASKDSTDFEGLERNATYRSKETERDARKDSTDFDRNASKSTEEGRNTLSKKGQGRKECKKGYYYR